MEMTKVTSVDLESRLFCYSQIDNKERLDMSLQSCFDSFLSHIENRSDSLANESLNQYISIGKSQHDEINLGLLYGILTERHNCSRYFRDLILYSRDQLDLISSTLFLLVNNFFDKLAENSRLQVIWILKESIRNNISRISSVIFPLLRNIRGGDTSEKNLVLAETVLDVLIENRSWMDETRLLNAMGVFTYLRILSDHFAPELSALRQKETDFCITIIRQRWSDCMAIGRDFIRLLHGVSRVPEFESLWKDIINNPSSLSPQFSGLTTILACKTQRKFIISRLTVDMERKIFFLMNEVKFGFHKRYQDWFQRQYMSTPDSQSLRADIIRYICTVFHPSNEQLNSGLTPRWAVVGWLLSTCTSPVETANAKLALFFDWLFYEPDRNSIMLVEPAVLVMLNSFKPFPILSVTLIEFLCRVIDNYFPPLRELFLKCVVSAFQDLLDKRVVSSYSFIFENPNIDNNMRSLLANLFPQFANNHFTQEANDVDENTNVVVNDSASNNNTVENVIMVNNVDHCEMPDAAFSDEEVDEIPPILKPLKSLSLNVAEKQLHLVNEISDDYKKLIMNIENEEDTYAQCIIVEQILTLYLSDHNVHEYALAANLLEVFKDSLSNDIVPAEKSEEALVNSVNKPIFTVFRAVCQASEVSDSRNSLIGLLQEMYTLQPRIGYLLLYFLKVSKQDESVSIYKELCKTMEHSDLKTCILNDMKICQEDDADIFCFLVPFMYHNFPLLINNEKMMHLIVSCVDCKQLNEILCRIALGELVLVRSQNLIGLIMKSLEWESIEQMFLWRIIRSHESISVESFITVIFKLEHDIHVEALMNIMSFLKDSTPSADILRAIFVRKPDLFSMATFVQWCSRNMSDLVDVFVRLINKALNNNTTTTRRRAAHMQQNKKIDPSIENFLSHLDVLRLSSQCKCLGFLLDQTVCTSITRLQEACTEEQIHKYADLFSLINSFCGNDVKVNKRSKRSAANSVKTNARPAVKDSTGSDSSSDDELKGNSRKRLRLVVADDESDFQ